MGNLGFQELLLIFVVALIVFGPRKLPELGKTLGATLAQFRRASEDFKRSWEQEVEVEKRRIEDAVVKPVVNTVPSLPPNQFAESPGDGGQAYASLPSLEKVPADPVPAAEPEKEKAV